MNRVTQFIIGLIAIALALGAGFYGRILYLKEVSTYQGPVPVNAIPAYTILKPELFQMRDMPRTMESLPYYQSIQALDGMISTVPLPAGLPIAQSNAVSVAQFRLADAAFEVLSIPVEPVSAVGGQIRIGEHVNLYQVSEEVAVSDTSVIKGNNQPGYKIELIAGSVLIVDVRNAQGVAADSSQKSDSNSSFNSSPQTEQVQILTLAVKPETVNDIIPSMGVQTTLKQKHQISLVSSSGEWIRTTDLRVMSQNPESVSFVRRALQISRPDELWSTLAGHAAVANRYSYSICFTWVRQVLFLSFIHSSFQFNVFKSVFSWGMRPP